MSEIISRICKKPGAIRAVDVVEAVLTDSSVRAAIRDDSLTETALAVCAGHEIESADGSALKVRVAGVVPDLAATFPQAKIGENSEFMQRCTPLAAELLGMVVNDDFESAFRDLHRADSLPTSLKDMPVPAFLDVVPYASKILARLANEAVGESRTRLADAAARLAV